MLELEDFGRSMEGLIRRKSMVSTGCQWQAPDLAPGLMNWWLNPWLGTYKGEQRDNAKPQ
jgi:hypothetical protein